MTLRCLRPLDCSIRMIFCALSICLTFSLTPATIAETEQRADLEAAGDGEQAPRLVRAHHQRDLLRLTDVIDLVCQIQSPQCHAEQEPQPGHDAVAIADAHASLGQVQLEAADILGCGRVGGAMEERGKPLAAANVAPPRARRELPRIHVLDHTVTQRGDGIRTHRKTPALDEVDDTSILKTGGPSAYRRSPIPVAGARRLVSPSASYRGAI